MVPVSAPVLVTIGTGGNAGAAGGTSSFGPAVSSTGGAAGTPSGASPNGVGTVAVGTELKTGNTAPFGTPVAAFGTPAGWSGTSPQFASVGMIIGNSTRSTSPATPTAGIAYSTSSIFIAGARGGLALQGGVGGAVLVEFVG
jgi:hypothetical protein